MIGAGFPTAWALLVTSRPPGKCSECLYGSSAPTTALGKVVGVWHLTAVGNAESKCTQLKYALRCPMGLGLRACVAHTVLPHSLCPRTNNPRPCTAPSDHTGSPAAQGSNESARGYRTRVTFTMRGRTPGFAWMMARPIRSGTSLYCVSRARCAAAYYRC